MAIKAEDLFVSVVHDIPQVSDVDTLFLSVVHDIPHQPKPQALFLSVVHDAPPTDLTRHPIQGTALRQRHFFQGRRFKRWAGNKV